MFLLIVVVCCVFVRCSLLFVVVRCRCVSFVFVRCCMLFVVVVLVRVRWGRCCLVFIMFFFCLLFVELLLLFCLLFVVCCLLFDGCWLTIVACCWLGVCRRSCSVSRCRLLLFGVDAR